MNVLLIWDNNPEELIPYLIRGVKDDQLEVLLEANNKYIGGDDDTEAVQKINIAITPNASLGNYDSLDPVWMGIWNQNKTEFPVTGPIDLVVRCGWIM